MAPTNMNDNGHANGEGNLRGNPQGAYDPEQARPSSTYDSAVWTDNLGHPVHDNMNSLSLGFRGPVLLEDYHLIEKLANFDRERTPERVVHARGMAAKGYFEVTHDISNLTCADLFSEVGKKTPVIARLSTVVHEKGSPESVRDVRGFSVKFYTNDGNWDFVGNNIPVFFIRDGLKFPDLVHSLKPNPRNHLQEGWRILDFLSHHPESCHILTWLLDEPGQPKSWRHLEGYGVHTFKLKKKTGLETLVKFHWRPTVGAAFVTYEEQLALEKAQFSGTKANWRHSHATRDLYEAIEKGEFPEWTFYIQTMDEAQGESLPFDPIDPTKVWPEDQFPLQPVGKMVLDRNVDNWFNENEMLAFNPGVLVPGITYTNDKLLQTRIFSYSDTQRYRIGGNYALLPVNAPRNKHHNNHYDGKMNMTYRNEEIDYFPSRKNRMEEAPYGWTYQSETVTGSRIKAPHVAPERENNFSQAGDRIRSMSSTRRSMFMMNVAEWMTDPKTTDEVRSVWQSNWAQCDKSFAQELEEKVKGMLEGGSTMVEKVQGMMPEKVQDMMGVKA